MEEKDSITPMKNECPTQGLATAHVLVLKLNYRRNTFARDTGINFSPPVQDREARTGGRREKIR